MSKTLLHFIPATNYGGTERALYTFLSNSSYRNSVISLTSLGSTGRKIEQLGIDVICLQAQKNPFRLIKILSIIRMKKPDLLCSWSYYTDLLTLIFGKAIFRTRIFWLIRRSIYFHEREPWYRKTLRIVLGKLSSFPDRIIYNSEDGRRKHEDFGFEKKSSITIPNGIDTHHFAPDSQERDQIRKQLNISSDHFLIGMVARYDEIKGHDVFLKTLEILRDISNVSACLIGMNVSQLKPIAAGFDTTATIHFIEPVENIRSYYCAFDLHILCSYAEGFPNAIAESMSCGTPSISTSVGEAPSIIGVENQIVPPGDPEKLAQAIKDYRNLSEEKKQERKSQSILRIREQYSNELFVKRLSAALT